MIEKLNLETCPLCGGAVASRLHLDDKGLPKAVRDSVNTPYRKAKETVLYLPNYKCKECYSVILPSYKGLNALFKRTASFRDGRGSFAKSIEKEYGMTLKQLRRILSTMKNIKGGTI